MRRRGRRLFVEEDVKRSFFAILFFSVFSACFAEIDWFSIPESKEIRASILNDWIYADLKDLRKKSGEVHRNGIGQEFQVRMEETDGSYAVIVAPKVEMDVDFYTESGVVKKRVSEYPGDACGSWILIKNSRTNRPERLKVFFSNNSDVYIQFEPEFAGGKAAKKCRGDFVISELYAARSVPVGVSFDALWEYSFYDLYHLTKFVFPWQYADIQRGQFSTKLQMINVIRKNAGKIVYLEDSCFDGNGRLINISDGKEKEFSDEEKLMLDKKIPVDDAGFLKWIADGIVFPLAGSRLFCEPLVVPTVKYNATGLSASLSRNVNLSWTLDWCRNLSAAIISIRQKKNYMWNEVGSDVAIIPFSGSVQGGEKGLSFSYFKDTGYQVSSLRPLLYVLAATEPTYCYFAAIKSPVRWENLSEFYVFDACAVIFPLFDDDGRFSCVIFECGKEYNLEQFTQKYSGCFVNLSRVQTTARFAPEF